MKFFTIKLHCIILKSCLTQLLCQFIEHNKLFGIFSYIFTIAWLGSRLPCSIFNSILFEKLLHLFVGIATIAFYNGMHYPSVCHYTLLIHTHDDTIAKFLLIGAKRTDIVTQSFWEHWNSTVDKIDRSGTLLSFLVNDRAFFHIVCDVCDMDADLPHASTQLPNRQCIVKILCIFGVYGTGKDVSEVLPSLQFCLRYIA